MNHAARHLCINSAQYTLANTNIRINNKLDTHKHTHGRHLFVLCADRKLGPEMNYKGNTRKLTPPHVFLNIKWVWFALLWPSKHLVSVQEGWRGCMDVTGLNLFGESMRVNGRQEGPFKKNRGPNADMGSGWPILLPNLQTPSSTYPFFTGHSVYHHIKKKRMWSTGYLKSPRPPAQP